MSVRTTVTLDDDNAKRLERLRKVRGGRMKEVVNHILRLGLDATEKPQKSRKPFETQTFPGSGPPLFPVDCVGEALNYLDELELREKAQQHAPRRRVSR